MKVKNLLIGLLIIIVLVLGGYLIYDNFIKEEPKQKTTKKVETMKEIKGEQKIKAMSNEEIDQYLVEINSGIDSTYLGQLIEYQDENYNLKLNTNLFDKLEIKSSIAVHLGDVKLKNKGEAMGASYYAPYEQFKKAYKITWDEKINESTHSIIDNEVYCYSIKKELGIPFAQIKAKEILFDNGIYIIKTVVGTFDNNSSKYDYNNNYEGQIRFEKNNEGYRIISYIIVQI